MIYFYIETFVYEVFFIGDTIDSIREETGENKYNMRIKMVWAEFMGEGYKHVV